MSLKLLSYPTTFHAGETHLITYAPVDQVVCLSIQIKIRNRHH